MTVASIMFALIRAELAGEELPADVREALTPETLAALYEMAQSQDLAHVVEQQLNKQGILQETKIAGKFKDASVKALYRYAMTMQMQKQVSDILEKNRIPFILLKGAVVRQFYPNPWLRTSCDVDVLVQRKDLDQAITALVNDGCFQCEGKGAHNVSLYAPNKMHLELHFVLLEENRQLQAQGVAKRVWEFASAVKPDSSQMVLTDEMFYFHHILHMAHHFCTGGCGIRPILDTWILKRNGRFDRDACEKLLAEGGLLTFARKMEQTAEVWFSGADAEPFVEDVLEYILHGGVYGNLENRVAMGQAKNGNKFKYILTQRIFQPYVHLKEKYPVLKKHKWLVPWYQVVRWKDSIIRHGMRTIRREMRTNFKASKERTNSAAELREYLGL